MGDGLGVGVAPGLGVAGFLATTGTFDFDVSLEGSLGVSFFAAGALAGAGMVAGGVSETCADALAEISKLVRIDIGRRSFMSGAIPAQPWLFQKCRLFQKLWLSQELRRAPA